MSNPGILRPADIGEQIPRIGTAVHKCETAEYIGQILLELRGLARGAELKELSDLLGPAYYCAFSLANQVKPSRTEIERLRKLDEAAGILTRGSSEWPG